jgi:hypothetical protein
MLLLVWESLVRVGILSLFIRSLGNVCLPTSLRDAYEESESCCFADVLPRNAGKERERERERERGSQVNFLFFSFLFFPKLNILFGTAKTTAVESWD